MPPSTLRRSKRIANAELGLTEDSGTRKRARGASSDSSESVSGRTSLPPPIDPLTDTGAKLSSTLLSTIRDRCSTSVFLLGPPGTSKTHTLNSVLDNLATAHRFRRLDLCGRVHGDERAAFSSMARQLRACSADEDQEIFISHANALAWLLQRMRELDESPVVVVLDSIELFALHPRQSLLYTLLDATQGRSVAIAVIGVSVRHDIVTLLEKRVRSRFSQKTLLFAPPDDPSVAISRLRTLLPPTALLDTLLAREIVAKVLRTSPDIRSLTAVFWPAAVFNTDCANGVAEAEAALRASYAVWRDARPALVERMSYLHECLLKVAEDFGRESFNFAALYERFLESRVRRQMLDKVLIDSRLPALQAFRDLMEAGILAPCSTFHAGTASDGDCEFAMVFVAALPSLSRAQ